MSTSSAPTATCTSSTSSPAPVGWATTSPSWQRPKPRTHTLAPARNDATSTVATTAKPPALQSGLSGYWGDDNSVHVFYFGAGTDNHVYQLRIFPGGPGWVWEDLTSLADGIVPMVSRALHSYLGSDQSQHVNYIGSG